jgi:DNA-binding FrmR family transcriptional regulator
MLAMSHHSDNPEADRRALKLRLRKITGQLHGVEKMIEGDYECAEVLNQLVSARRAIKSLSEKIIHEHLEHCLTHPTNDEQGRKQVKEVALMLKRYVD